MQVRVPELGESITSAIVARWIKSPSQQVSKDEPILELETDKVSVEVPAPVSGVIESVNAKEGDEVAVGDVVCTIAEGATSTQAPQKTQTPTTQQPASEKSDVDYDVVVIGAGPGGYSCAIRAAQLGLKVACVEKGSLGGTCLNVGCIPSKALLQASENYHALCHDFQKQGIEVSGAKINLKKMQEHKKDIVQGNVKGIAYLFKKNGVTLIEGGAKIVAPGELDVAGKHIRARNIIIATGSHSATLPGLAIDEKHIVSSTGALEFTKVPKKLAVIGGGVIGVELGSVWRRLGSEVTIIEFLPHLLGNTDRGVEKAFVKEIKRQGFAIQTQQKVTSCQVKGDQVVVEMEALSDGKTHKETFDKVLVAVGRKASSDNLGLDEVGVKRDKRGFIEVDDRFSTNIDGIYAIGDVIGGAMLAHKASEEGVALAEILVGQQPIVDYGAIPSVVYTWPEVASVGMTEEALKERGIDYHVGKFPFKANGRAKTLGTDEGFVKILAQPQSDRILGVHIFGPCAGELIAEATMALEFGASSEDIARICHAHPTLSEVVREAALDVDNRAINM